MVTYGEDALRKIDGNRDVFLREYRAGKTVLASRPLGLVVLLTNRCNLSCIMCGYWREKPADLPQEAVRKLLPLFEHLEMVNWQGGETFVVPYFRELFAEVSRRYPEVRQCISTNGLLIDEGWAETLSHAHLDITFSIDAVDKETYEHIRRGGTFENILRSIDRLNGALERNRGRRVDKALFAVLMRSNYRQVPRILEFAKQHGFTRVQFAPKYGMLPGEDLFDRPDEPALRELAALLPGAEEYARKENIQLTHPFGYLNAPADNRQDAPSAQKLSPACNYPWYKMTVFPNGDVRPDCICPVVVGNLLREDPDTIWNGPGMKLYREKIASGDTAACCSEACNAGRYLGLELNRFEER